MMHKTNIVALIILSILIADACMMGLNPAGKANEATTVSIRFNSLADSIQAKNRTGSRAMIQGGGYLYIQTGMTAADAVLYGPYAANPGSVLEIKNLPAGTYPFFALVYADGIKQTPDPILVTTGSESEAAFLAALLQPANISDPSKFSFKMLTNVTLLGNQVNQINATLIPLTTDNLDATNTGAAPAYFNFTSSGTSLVRKFIKLTNVGSGIPAGNALAKIKFTLTNTATSTVVQFARFALYNADGTLNSSSQAPAQSLSPYGTMEALLAAYSGGTEFFAYIEFTGTNIQLSLTPEMTTTFVAVSSDGSSRNSINGSSWAGPNATGLTTCTGIAWGGSGLFVAAGTSSSTYGLVTSTDGLTWTARTLPGTAPSALTCIASNPSGQLLAISQTGATCYAYTSSDGTTWAGPGTLGIYPTTNPSWLDGAWYITSGNGVGWKTSTDGYTWTTVSGAGSNMYQVNSTTAVNHKLIAGGGAPSSTNKQVRISSDYGVTFGSTLTVTTATGYVTAFAVTASNRVISVGSGTAAQINWSDDSGSTWTTATFSGTSNVQSVCWSPLGVIAGDASSAIYRSTDNGATFSSTGTASAAVTGIAYKAH